MQHSIIEPFEIFDASAYRVGIVVGKFNQDITEQLLSSAREKLAAYGVAEENIGVYFVAGCVEIPVVLQRLASTKKFDCLIALGAIIRGETPHFDYVAKIVSEGISRVTLDHAIAIGFGVLTIENKDQALARVTSGAGAAEAALQTTHTLKSI